MTSFHTEYMACPECNTDFTLTFPKSICTWLNPELITELLQDDGNIRHCPHCGVMIHIAAPVLINGPTGMFWLNLGADTASRRTMLEEQQVIDGDGNVDTSRPNVNVSRMQPLQKRPDYFL